MGMPTETVQAISKQLAALELSDTELKNIWDSLYVSATNARARAAQTRRADRTILSLKNRGICADIHAAAWIWLEAVDRLRYPELWADQQN